MKSIEKIKKKIMGNYRQIFYHIVFSTKHRKPCINAEHEEELFRYISGIIRNKKCHLHQINGMEDHIHIFSDLHPTVCLSNFVKDLKIASNLWMKQSGKFPDFEEWQEGYGAFTYSVREKETIINYIKNQKKHHQGENSAEEFRRLLIENDVDFDEKYFE